MSENWQESRDHALAQVERNAGETFVADAKAFVISYLAKFKAGASGEEITDACKRAGIVPHNDKAFGAVYMSLSRSGQIVKCGTTMRHKGHGTAGGILWSLPKPTPVQQFHEQIKRQLFFPSYGG